ncbi:disease resistance RPP13-like protein 4 [Carex rostrata]
MLLNLDQKYLNSYDIIDITNNSKHDHLEVVQLGSWRCTKTYIPETVRFLSLRGISGITELHESIGKLDLLTVLDLRACHNLEKLPDKPRSILNPKLIRRSLPQERWFMNLEVLDISGCYLLDHMPKWVCELSNLKVLKGFVVGSMEQSNQFCQLVDLSKLNKLTKLSIRISVNISDPEVFSGFDSLESLLVLTITWGQNKYGMIPTYSLSKNLEKLDIRCYPEPEASKLQNPNDLQKLKRLYIRGGNVTKIPHNDNWKVEILRLRFLKKLVPIEWNEVRSSFKNLEYVEFVGCPRPRNFPNIDQDSWRKSSLQERESVLVPGNPHRMA